MGNSMTSSFDINKRHSLKRLSPGNTELYIVSDITGDDKDLSSQGHCIMTK